MIVEEVRQCRQEFALCEIASGTEDHNGARLWRFPILPDRVLLEFTSHMNILGHEHLSSEIFAVPSSTILSYNICLDFRGNVTILLVKITKSTT
jgi:hypothetical protein